MENWQTQSESIGKLALALSKAQAQFNGANKSSDNPFFKSKYADLFECINATKEHLTANELAVIQTTEPAAKGVDIITTLAHSSGEWVRGRINMQPKKDDDQARGSSITYGRRYGYAAIVGLAQKDDDGNESVTPPTKKDKAKQLDESCARLLAAMEKYTDAKEYEQFWNGTVKGVLPQYTDDQKKQINKANADILKDLEEANK